MPQTSRGIADSATRRLTCTHGSVLSQPLTQYVAGTVSARLPARSQALTGSVPLCRLPVQSEAPPARPQEGVEAKVMEPDKCSEWGWVPFAEMPQPRFAPLQALLDSGLHPGDDREALKVRLGDSVQPSRPSVDVGQGSKSRD